MYSNVTCVLIIIQTLLACQLLRFLSIFCEVMIRDYTSYCPFIPKNFNCHYFYLKIECILKPPPY